MGAGKTTVAQLLAARWDVEMRDTDHDVEASAGKEIAEIFLDDGEEHFRALERAAVTEALTGHRGVLALGGGAVLDASTRAVLRGLGVGRPLVLGNVRARIKALLDERLPVYTEVAAFTVDTDGRSAEEVAADVASLVEDAEREGVTS